MMDDFFPKAVEKILANEGGYVKDPSDPGGETNFGISKRSYPLLDIENLTKEQAKSIYYRDYWLGSKCNLIKDFELAQKVFDLSVNLGITTSIKMIQRALRCLGKDLEEDGLPGPKTLSGISEVNQFALLCALKSEAAGHYRGICLSNSNLTKFLHGWLNRAYR
jgi:lysozyme family protein